MQPVYRKLNLHGVVHTMYNQQLCQLYLSGNSVVCAPHHIHSRTTFVVRNYRFQDLFQAKLLVCILFWFSHFDPYHPDCRWLFSSVHELVRNKVKYLVNNLQKVNRSQSVQISDKHIKTILRQMTSKYLTLDNGMRNGFSWKYNEFSIDLHDSLFNIKCRN